VRVLALSDPHLAEGTPDKSMAIFGPPWEDHPQTMVERWRATVRPDDVVIVAGDVSWARTLDQVRPDLDLLASLPGRKVLIRGNHDHWWQSAAKVRGALPAGLHALAHDALLLDGVAIAGTRLWDDPEVRLDNLPLRPGTTRWVEPEPEPAEEERNAKILARELGRLEAALSLLDPAAAVRIAVVHYPPVGTDLAPTRAARLLEAARVDHCVFGHLHGLLPRTEAPLFGTRNGVTYHLTSCDYLEMTPVEIARV